MLVALILSNNKIEIATGKGGKRPVLKKQFDIETESGQIRNGEILDSMSLGKEILKGLKAKKVVPNQVAFAVRSNEIVITEVTIPIAEKKLILQGVRIALNEKYPGVLDKNHLAYKIYDVADGMFHIMVAMAPKDMIEGYYSLSKFMKCRLIKIDLYANCIAKALGSIPAKKEANQIIVDVDDNFFQIYYMSGGIIQMNNNFAIQQNLSNTDKKHQVRKQMLDKVSQNISTMASVIGESNIEYVCLNHREQLNSEEISCLIEEVQKTNELELKLMEDILPENKSKALLKALLWEQKIVDQDMNFALELNINDTINYQKADVATTILASLSITAALGIGGYAFYTEELTKELQGVTVYNQEQVKGKEDINELYKIQMTKTDEKKYLDSINSYLEVVHYDASEVRRDLELAMERGNSSLKEFYLNSDLSVNLVAGTDRLKNITLVLQSLKENGFEGVVLQSVEIGDEQEAEKLTYSIYGRYLLETEVVEQ